MPMPPIPEAEDEKESPIIILPGASEEKNEKEKTPDIFPDEEIIIENPEEEPEEIVEEV